MIEPITPLPMSRVQVERDEIAEHDREVARQLNEAMESSHLTTGEAMALWRQARAKFGRPPTKPPPCPPLPWYLRLWAWLGYRLTK